MGNRFVQPGKFLDGFDKNSPAYQMVDMRWLHLIQEIQTRE